MTLRILFVCLGNICRSPSAEAVFRERLGHLDIHFDSAGTSDWHIGESPDPRAVREGDARGYDLTPLRGRQVTEEDFHVFDFILAMDLSNLRTLKKMQPAGSRAEVALLGTFISDPAPEVPDPYYNNSFDRVFDLLESAADGLRKSPPEPRQPVG
ncbi:MAG: low molecular weight protein-tyrosine-phosphatase [Pseudomonadota bacterium]